MSIPDSVYYGDRVKLDGKPVTIINVERNWWNKPPTLASVGVKYDDGYKETVVYWDFGRFTDYEAGDGTMRGLDNG